MTHVLDLTGLTDVAGRGVNAFSLGMGQRLGIAAALLGDPATVTLDEPVNGLDPEGVLRIRTRPPVRAHHPGHPHHLTRDSVEFAATTPEGAAA
ncbi:hypothetical protein SSP24_74190 [Streptomyces spinoverrucosus]|uniref:ABC transporter domain-containing protein n=1 Tax=Streptomyces spinoverrucosus TaxID=284043 RepID=A0A4Y3VS21_9ACTN|nr:hypothetical protein SSP24_74190 [Streptomyces spinoverrucosus]GHB52193.1 hypothetical protein GCM10010397_22580 [Streptomyces spinoverrucosus]